MLLRSLATVTAVSFGIVSSAAAETAGSYLYSDRVITTLELPGFASGINDSGEIVGIAHSQAYIYDNGSYTYLNPPGYTETQTLAINNNGQVLGYSNDSIPEYFIYTNGTYQSFTITAGVPTSINDSGEIVGYNGATSEGFVIGGPSVNNSLFVEPTGINDHGQIIGFCGDLCGGGSFLYTDGVFTLIRFPGAISTRAVGINNEGQIVGEAFYPNRDVGGFLYSDGTYTPFDYGPLSPYNYTYAVSINDSGQIIGTFYLGINTPEPSTWAMMLIGFAGLGFISFRRTAAHGLIRHRAERRVRAS
jgi:probable HAF family extracellular repeat protein